MRQLSSLTREIHEKINCFQETFTSSNKLITEKSIRKYNLSKLTSKAAENISSTTKTTIKSINKTDDKKYCFVGNLMSKNLSAASKRNLGLWSDIAREKRVFFNLFGDSGGGSNPPDTSTVTTTRKKSSWYSDDDYYMNGTIIDFKNGTILLFGRIFNRTHAPPPENKHAWLYVSLLCEYVTLIFVAASLCLSAAFMKYKNLIRIDIQISDAACQDSVESRLCIPCLAERECIPCLQ